jgi:Na+/melibiose symporter-like transporter
VGLSFTILEAVFAFQPAAENSEAALQGLLWTYAIGTAAGLLLAALPVINYPLNRAQHQKIRDQLDARA